MLREFVHWTLNLYENKQNTSQIPFLTKIEIKITYLVFLSCCLVFHRLFASRAIWKPFYRRLRFWVAITSRKSGFFYNPIFCSNSFVRFFVQLSSCPMSCPNVGPISCPISCLIFCEFLFFFCSDSSFVLLSAFIGCLENDDLENEVQLKSKVNNSFVRLRIVPIFPQG